MFSYLKHLKRPKRLYLDTAAATPVAAKVVAAMKPYAAGVFGNPGSIHREGVVAAVGLEKARTAIANILFARPAEIIFTAGGTESNNLAIFGVAERFAKERGGPGQIITLATEHKSVLAPLAALAQKGWDIRVLPVARGGELNLKLLEKEISPATALVSIAYANNEIGTITPLSAIAKIIRRVRKDQPDVYPLFHTDACQAPRFLSLKVDTLGVDLMTLNGSKMYGPKGSGVLYAAARAALFPLFYGGGQEGGLRAGTANVAGAIGFAAALRLCEEKRAVEAARLASLRDYFLAEAKKIIPGLIIHGSEINRLPNNINITIPGVEAEWAVIQFDARGIACSTGSACSVRSAADHHILTALYGAAAPTEGAVRFTLGREAKKKDMDKLLAATAAIFRMCYIL